MNHNLKIPGAHKLHILDGSSPDHGPRSKNPETACSSSCLSSTEENINSESKKAELFTATAVHDLKGYLQQIASGVSLLRRKYAKVLDVNADQILVGMSSGVARMNKLVADILLLSKAKEESHRLELVDLNEIARSAVADLQPVIETNNANISIEELPVVCGDKAQLYQVFQNLLNNALKYRKPQVAPYIMIRSRIIPNDELTSTDYSHEISIEDNGIGFTTEQGESIFQSFHRLNNPNIEGTGLGLSICERIVTEHRGSIRAEGKPGVGAKFFIQLPSTEYCEKSDDCNFASTSYDKKCPALERQRMETKPVSQQK